MRARLRTVVWSLVASTLGFVSASAPAGAPCSLTLYVSTFRSTRGALICRLFAGPDGFPSRALSARQVRFLIPGKVASCEFQNLAPGVYAVALFHDENDNGVLDTNFLGIPREGVGASNDPRPLIGPPSWSDSKFSLQGNAVLRVTLRY